MRNIFFIFLAVICLSGITAAKPAKPSANLLAGDNELDKENLNWALSLKHVEPGREENTGSFKSLQIFPVNSAVGTFSYSFS